MNDNKPAKTTMRGMRRTLGDLVLHQLTLWMHCHKCRCVTQLNVERLFEVHGAEVNLKKVLATCVCENCGAHWPDIDVEVPPRQAEESVPQDLSDADP